MGEGPAALWRDKEAAVGWLLSCESTTLLGDTAMRPLGIFLLFFVAAVIGFCVILEQLSPYESITEEVFLLVDRDTQYAPGYSQQAFGQIQVGDSEARVQSLIGSPLSSQDSGNGSKWLRYSCSPRSTHYRQRTICIANGSVAQIVAEMYFD